MPNQPQVVVCQRCGRGFVLTTTYCDFLARRRVKVVVPMLCLTCFLKAGPLPKQHGRVKWFNRRKHYGFIITEGGEEVFLHQRQLLGGKGNELHKGQTARFHVRYSTKGPEALNVELIEG
ncbi:MAG: cold shock domain-containing protein [Anaerolineae bacterium]